MRTSGLCWMVVPMIADACGAVRNDPALADASASVSVDAPAARLAASCVDLGLSAAGQEVRLYLDGDARKPYAAHCSDGLGTYLVLDEANTTSYPAGGCATLMPNATAAVTTIWHMVRFDPVERVIDTSDLQFTTSSGGTHETSGNGGIQHDYLSVPFGSGRSCVTGTPQPVAAIDLTGTRFALAASQTWATDGFAGQVQATINPQRTKATITAMGFPVGASPCGPNSDYYTLNGGACLQLDYVP